MKKAYQRAIIELLEQTDEEYLKKIFTLLKEHKKKEGITPSFIFVGDPR